MYLLENQNSYWKFFCGVFSRVKRVKKIHNSNFHVKFSVQNVIYSNKRKSNEIMKPTFPQNLDKYSYLFINHLEQDAITPGICGMKNKLPKNGNAGGPKK